MLSKLRFIFLGLLILAVAGLVVSAISIWNKAKPITTTLPDGYTIWVRDVLSYTNNFTTDTTLYKLGRKYLPVRWQGWIPTGVNAGSCGPKGCVTVYMTHKNASGGFMNAFWERVDAIDDEGFVYQN